MSGPFRSSPQRQDPLATFSLPGSTAGPRQCRKLEAPRDVAAPDEADRSRPIGRRRGLRPAPAVERVLSETSTQIGAIRLAASPSSRDCCRSYIPVGRHRSAGCAGLTLGRAIQDRRPLPHTAARSQHRTRLLRRHRDASPTIHHRYGHSDMLDGEGLVFEKRHGWIPSDGAHCTLQHRDSGLPTLRTINLDTPSRRARRRSSRCSSKARSCQRRHRRNGGRPAGSDGDR
jgi:hypothetical protein